MREKPGIPAHSCVSWEVSPEAGLRGWSGRDRTHAFLFELVSTLCSLYLGISSAPRPLAPRQRLKVRSGPEADQRWRCLSHANTLRRWRMLDGERP
jgi:hypothetical protein